MTEKIRKAEHLSLCRLTMAILLGSSWGCAADVGSEDALGDEEIADVGSSDEALAFYRGLRPGFNQGEVIDVCFLTKNFAGDKRRVRDAITNTWDRSTALQFGGWKDCPSPAPSTSVTIRFRWLSRDPDGFYGEGWAGRGSRSRMDPAAQIILDYGQNRKNFDWLAVHEMGHVLGFGHEHARPDRDLATAICESGAPIEDLEVLTGFDSRSVMNYCRDFDNDGVPDKRTEQIASLSAEDIRGARIVYGL